MKILLCFLFPFLVSSENQFLENMEAIEHFEDVFDMAATLAGAKETQMEKTNRRWDFQQTGWNGALTNYRTPSVGIAAFRNENQKTKINFLSRRHQRTINKNKYQNMNSQPSQLVETLNDYKYRHQRNSRQPRTNVDEDNLGKFYYN